MDDAEIRAVIARLARPHASGGFVVGRAAILAEGADFAAMSAWILAHGGVPEALAPAGSGRGLHSSRPSHGGERPSGVTSYRLPAEAFA